MRHTNDPIQHHFLDNPHFAVSMDYPTAILDSISADCDMKDFFVGLNATAAISGSNHSLSPAMMKIAEERISLPVVKEGLRELNQKYLDIEDKNQQSIQSSGMSLGESKLTRETSMHLRN